MGGMQNPLGMGRGNSRDEFDFSIRIVQHARYIAVEFLMVIEILDSARAIIAGDAFNL
jgi:hypothetical protein